MLKKYLLLPILFIAMTGNTINAQTRTFKAGLTAGGNITQLDGDKWVGFDKRGLQFGARGLARLTERIYINVELLYNQKGAAFGNNPNAKKENKIGLNYAEVPIMIDLAFVKVNSEHYKHHFTAGIGYSRLIQSNFKEVEVVPISFKPLEPKLNKNELSPIFGYSYFFTSNIAIDFRYSFAFTEAYTRDSELLPSGVTDIEFLRNYYASARVSYIF